ncbi:hypothetical protein Tco_1513301 [Tanacetum coccineum]
MTTTTLRYPPAIPFSHHPFTQTLQIRISKHPFKTQHRHIKTTKVAAALTEWREYEEAVKDKDLGRALRFLKQTQLVENDELRLLELQRDWDVLDTCLNADDMRLVASAYSFLKDKGFLNCFGKYRSIGNVSLRPNLGPV